METSHTLSSRSAATSLSLRGWPRLYSCCRPPVAPARTPAPSSSQAASRTLCASIPAAATSPSPPCSV
eukprot:5801305-Pyramimonas_sp.AAC.1